MEVHIREDDYIAVAAHCHKTGYSQAGLLITDPDGLITSMPDNLQMELNVNAYPNPFSQVINFDFAGDIQGKTILRVYNSTGKLMYNSSVSGWEKDPGFQWNGTNNYGQELPRGVYLYQITKENNFISRGKIIKN